MATKKPTTKRKSRREKTIAEILAPIRAALHEHPGELDCDEVGDALCDAFGKRSFRLILSAISEAADEPDLVRVLCGEAQANVRFCEQDMEWLGACFGYAPITESKHA